MFYPEQMNYFWRVVALTFALALPLRAQENAISKGKVYQPVPSYAYARVPKGGYSRFYGAARFGAPANQEVRIHFYYWPANLPSSGESEDNFQAHRNYRVDVFVRKIQRHANFHLVQSVDIPTEIFNGIEPAMDTVGFDLRWLTPNKQTPLIHLKIFNNGFSAPFGTDITLTFPGGWQGKAVIQGFNFHGDHSEFVHSELSVDENGIAQIARIYTTTDAPDKITLWTWNGQMFSAEKLPE